MLAYKQWSGPTREKRFAEYKRARRRGDIPPPGPCEMCGQTVGTMHHAEDYGPTWEAYVAAMHSLCGRCHAALHLRFRFPGRWAAYKHYIRTQPLLPPVKNMGEVFYRAGRQPDMPIVEHPHNGEWWEMLTMDRYTGELL
jgi:hypothetical protein